MRQKGAVSVGVSSTGLEYTFTYNKRKREFQKLVQFFKIGETPIYSLGFGQLALDGNIDDQVRADQNYRDQALTIVAALVYEFTARNPHRFVFFTGSDDVRTKLFCRIISAHFDQLSDDFDIYGIAMNKGYKAERFRQNGSYAGFIIKRKNSLLTDAAAVSTLKKGVAFGVKVKTHRSVNMFSGRNMFQAKTSLALKIISMMRWESGQ